MKLNTCRNLRDCNSTVLIYLFLVPNNSHVLKYFEDGMKNNTQSVPSRVEIQDGMLEIRRYYYLETVSTLESGKLSSPRST